LLRSDDISTFGASIIVQVEYLERCFRVFYSWPREQIHTEGLAPKGRSSKGLMILAPLALQYSLPNLKNIQIIFLGIVIHEPKKLETKTSVPKVMVIRNS